LGDEGDGVRLAMMALDGGRIGIASQSLGIATGALEKAASSVSKDAPLARTGELGAAKARLAGARLLVLRAARLKESQARFSLEASMAKVYATETAVAVCRLLAQHRSEMTSEAAAWVDRALRDVRVTMIYEGTSEVQR